MFMKQSLLAALLSLVMLPHPAAQPAPAQRDTLAQTALLQSLMLGDYYGSVPLGQLKTLGDTGIGTFDRLDGELIMLDGVVYQALSDGTLATPDDDMTVPFSNVTFLDADKTLTLGEVVSMEDLKTQLTAQTDALGSNQFYMGTLHADFDYIQYRSEYAQSEPYIPLADVMRTDQVVFEAKNVSGTIVALYCPPYMDGLNTPGWHFHFVSDDRTIGGHMLDVRFAQADVILDQTPQFQMVLPDGEFFAELDLTTDLEAAIRKVEQNREG